MFCGRFVEFEPDEEVKSFYCFFSSLPVIAEVSEGKRKRRVILLLLVSFLTLSCVSSESKTREILLLFHFFTSCCGKGEGKEEKEKSILSLLRCHFDLDLMRVF